MNLYFKKLENHEEIDIFLDLYKLTKLNKEDRRILNKPIACNDIGAVIKKKHTY